MKQVHVIFSGFVQGVGLRQFIKKNAEKLGLGGWVQNSTDGNVECLFEGEVGNIEKIIEICKEGPELAEIDDVNISWNSPEGIYEDFEIL